MKVEIVTTGTELLLGEIVDTNAVFIAKQLREIGANLYYKTSVGDNQQRLAEVLRLGLSRSDVILVTGGLGPTVDDITREAVAEATGCPLEQRPEIVEHLQEIFARWQRKPTANNMRQSFLPRGAIMLPNPIGTAPGFIVETGKGAIVCMPGVPREMKQMMAEQVIPYLKRSMGQDSGVIVTRILHTVGLGESSIDDRIGHLMTGANPTVGLAAHVGSADVRIAARAATAAEAAALIAPVETEIRRQLGLGIYGIDDETLAGVTTALLRKRGQSLAILETNTGGQIAKVLQDEAPDLTITAHCARSDAEVAELLRINEPPALTDSDVATSAQRLLAHEQTDMALVVLGTASESQGFWSNEQGQTWLALATHDAVTTRQVGVGGRDDFTQQWLTIYGLNFLRLQLLKSSAPT